MDSYDVHVHPIQFGLLIYSQNQNILIQLLQPLLLISTIMLFIISITFRVTSGAPEFISGFKMGLCCSIFRFLCSVLQIIVCAFVLILLVIVLSVLRFSTSDYLFVILNLFIVYFLRSAMCIPKSLKQLYSILLL